MNQTTGHHRHTEMFTTETAGLAEVGGPSVVRLSDGDSVDLRISPVRKHVGENVLRMLAYNGSITGPVLHVDQGSEVTVNVTNDGDTEATVHWHGLRLENRFDGVPHETQEPIPVGGTYACRLQFPDAGFHWYHPHIREDHGLETGLCGTILVEPADAAYWPSVDRQVSITVDDLLVEDGHIAPFLMGATAYSRLGLRIQRQPDTVTGIGRRGLRRAGVTLRPRLIDADATSVRFADGATLDVGAVIWATGYRPDHRWIHIPGVLADGGVIHRRGVTDVAGLYFLGPPWQHTRGSALLGSVHHDAAHLAGLLATAPHACRTPALTGR